MLTPTYLTANHCGVFVFQYRIPRKYLKQHPDLPS